MKITFLGAAHEVTGSCTLLEVNNKKLVIDCGMEQGADTYENAQLPVSPEEIDCVFLTHAHIDHSGKLPVLTRGGFTGKVYTTSATRRLCSIMLTDSAHIQEQEALWRNKKAKRQGKPEYTPMYTQEDVKTLLSNTEGCEYNTEYEIYPDIKVKFTDAGHLLGSASIEIAVCENGRWETILFSGDLGNINRPLIRDPQIPGRADYVVIESTYGDREHGERKDYEAQLTEIIQSTLDKGGNVIIPAFAVGRTQEFLYLIHCIKQKGKIKGHPDFPVWVDSPLAIEATKIYDGSLTGFYDEETLRLISGGEDILDFPGINFSVTAEESRAINDDPAPKVIISASGMCEAGRIRHHLKHNLWREESTVLFVGYQSEGTVGRQLLDGEKEVKLFNEKITVKARIEQMDGISGHADRSILLSWLKNLKPKTVFVNHGEDEVVESFAREINEKYGFNTLAPYSGAIYDLSAGKCLDKGNTTPKKDKKSEYAYLEKEGKKLLGLIESYKNKDKEKSERFANALREFIRKWE